MICMIRRRDSARVQSHLHNIGNDVVWRRDWLVTESFYSASWLPAVGVGLAVGSANEVCILLIWLESRWDDKDLYFVLALGLRVFMVGSR